MSEQLPRFGALVVETLRAPRDAARRVIALNLPERVGWEALALGILLTVVIFGIPVELYLRDASDEEAEFVTQVWGNPLVVTFGQALNSVVMVFAIDIIGRFFGGQGNRAGAVALVAWHQIFILAIGVAGVLVGTMVPFVLSLVVIGLIVLWFFVLTQFICALHGFTNSLAVFVMVLLSMVSIGFLVTIVSGILIAIFFGASPNV
ncbi:YIP1 family protein [Tropicimonas aquimaris]|uniref:YIP1 family protein n=1 Tax=Tropicimonas aquimaris TaxID=914152 RepID=A0ABW3IS64_9RHOB